MGPVTFSELKDKIVKEGLNPRLDMVWGQGMAAWRPAGEVEGLFERKASLAVEMDVLPVPASSLASVEVVYKPQSCEINASRTTSSHPSSPVRKFFFWSILPFAVIFVSAGWATFWLIHDFLWSLAPDTTVHIPWVVLIFVYGGSGYILGKPFGKWLSHFPFRNNLLITLTCIVVLIGAAIAGELLYSTALLFLANQPIGLRALVTFVINPFISGDFMGFLAALMQLLLRSLLLVGVAASAFSTWGSQKSQELVHDDDES